MVARLADARGRRRTVEERQTALEGEVSRLSARIVDVERRLYGGTVTASRELQAMAAEVDSLRARRSSLEDDVLLAMEEAEPLDAEVAGIEAEEAAVTAEVAELSQALREAEAAVDAETGAERELRDRTAAAIPGDLLGTYERLRAKLGGVGAARLVGSSCSGCHLVLPATEVDRLKKAPPDALVFCEQCGRILVR